MNTEAMSALKQVNATIGQLQAALNDPSLTPQESGLIQQSIDDLSDQQDTILNKTLQAMVDEINSSNKDLQGLIKKMQAESDKLGKLADTIKKVSDVVGTLAEITQKAIGAGLLGE